MQAELDAALAAAPFDLRDYLTPLVAFAISAYREQELPDMAQAFKQAGKLARKKCCCCILRSKPRCCKGISLLQRAAKHRCRFCASWILCGYCSTGSRSMAVALDIAKLPLEEAQQIALRQRGQRAASADQFVGLLLDYHARAVAESPPPISLQQQFEVLRCDATPQKVPRVVHQVRSDEMLFGTSWTL
jgi:hypothetical protein